MPELPEAETIATQIAQRLTGQKLDRVVHIRSDIIKNKTKRCPPWLTDSAISRVYRRGKRIVISLGDDHGIIVYLGMSGQLDVQPASESPRLHTHFRATICDSDHELRFSDTRRFGGIRFFTIQDNEEPEGLAELGIEPLTMKPREFKAVLTCRRQIKALLMDQHAIAGLGNIYCDEALFSARIHPLELADTIDEKRVNDLCRAIKSILKAAIRAKGSTIQSYQHAEGAGGFQNSHRVYGRAEQPCTACDTPIEKIVVGGRSTHYCPVCQVAPTKP